MSVSIHTTQRHTQPPLWLAILAILLLFILSNDSFAKETPPGWTKHFDNKKQTTIFRPIDSESDLFVKYYPTVLLERKDISVWLKSKLTTSKAPNGKWINKETVIRDTGNYAHGYRKFLRNDGTTARLDAVAVTADKQYVRLAVMMRSENNRNKRYKKQGFSLVVAIYDIEKRDALEQDRGHDLEKSPPKVKGIKSGGPIKYGRYVGTKTRYKKVKSRYELILYKNGEYEFELGSDKSGYITYSQATGRLNISGDFYNFGSYSDDFCIYGVNTKTNKHTIYARDDDDIYRLNWTNEVNDLSPNQKKKLAKKKKVNKKRYKYVTNPGDGIQNDQIEAILYTYDNQYGYGGFETDEDIYLLMKDGRVMDGIPVAPNRLDVAKSRSREPDRWGWWKYDGKRYSFAWSIDSKKYIIPKGRQIKGQPVPPATRLQGKWQNSSSYTSLDFSHTSFWGVFLSKDGRFRKYRNDMMQGGGEMSGNGPLVTTYSNEKGSVTSVIGSNVGGGSSSKNNRADSDRVGSYEFDGFNLTLRFDNGVEKLLPTFTTSDKFNTIWFDGGSLGRDK
ncbi:MAG: hypothetical protein ABW139_16700 [Candidatus Thiodiazotropha sp. DIVDIV]